MSLRLRTPLPSLEGAAAWLHGEPTPEDLEGHPLVVQFWSISCHICHETAEQIAAWRKAAEPLKEKWAAAVKKAGVDPDIAYADLKATLEKYNAGF